MPVYYIIAEMKTIPPIYVPVFIIIKVIECTLEEAISNDLYDKEVKPLLENSGRNIQTMYFYREPSNPFAKSRGKVL